MDCNVEAGWECSSSPSLCTTVCGDGLRLGAEECDDLNNGPEDDGCDSNCKVTSGWSCDGVPSVCTTACGDGIIAGQEQCDDQDPLRLDDGCDGSCNITSGWKCVDAPSVCEPVCGDGAIVGSEECDGPGPGCTACKVDRGWMCSGKPSLCETPCGDGIIAGDEECDDSVNSLLPSGCASCKVQPGFTCVGEPSSCATTCGDGIKAGVEACDDGNPMDLDGCNHLCRPDVFTEQEPNNTISLAGAPLEPAFLMHGSVLPAADEDIFTFTVPTTVDLLLETFDGSGLGRCWDTDTVLEFLDANGNILAVDDESGLEACSRIHPDTHPAAARLAAGTYGVRVRSFNNVVPVRAYVLLVRFLAVCGDTLVQGREQCDGSAGCDATCARIPDCGNGMLEAGEQCDDGPVASMRCGATCQLEGMSEVEPNDTAAQAGGPFQPLSKVVGSISPASDQDVFAVSLNQTSDLRVVTRDASGVGCVGVDTVVTLLAPDGTTVLIQRDQGGLGNCGAIHPESPLDSAAQHLPAGTYFVRVTSARGATVIPGYTLYLDLVATCGNGLVEGAEECDGSAGCTATCERVPACSDGFVDAPETCDDGNTQDGDACSGACQLELLATSEPNDTPATASGPSQPTALLAGSISPVGDVDFYAVMVPATADLLVDVQPAADSDVNCQGMDTVATLYAPDGTTVLFSQDDGGRGMCSRMDPARDVAVRHLAPGTYFLKVEDFQNNGTIAGYRVLFRFAALCGNGLVEGGEQCDGSATCDATCKRIPSCGDGYVDGAEQCDDGATMDLDGCSSMCALEALAEVEPNDSNVDADASPLQPVLGNMTLHVTGAVGAVGDVDVVRLTVPLDTLLFAETSDTNPQECTQDSSLELRNGAGAITAQDDNSGRSTCAAITMPVGVGPVWLAVRHGTNSATIPGYSLNLRAIPGSGTEAEPNDADAMGNPLPVGSHALGSHQLQTDVDVFSVMVMPGQSLRVELVEGGPTSCDALAFDPMITVVGPDGHQLAEDDDNGRGYCPLLDGTSSSPADPALHNLAGGTYLVRVEAAFGARGLGDGMGVFDYRLAVLVE